MKRPFRSYFYGFAFVTLLLAAGFFIERQILQLAPRFQKVSSAPQKTDIILVGGSILIGIAESLQNHLNSMWPEGQLKVKGIPLPQAGSDQVLGLLDGWLESEKPKMVVLLLGMNEVGPSQSAWNAGRMATYNQVNILEHGEDAARLAKEGKKDELLKIFTSVINQSTEDLSGARLDWLSIALWRGSTWLNDKKFLTDLRDVVFKKVHTIYQKPQKYKAALEVFSRLCAIGNMLEGVLHQNAGWPVQSIHQEQNLDTKKQLYTKLVQHADQEVQFALNTLKQDGCDSYIKTPEGGSLFTKYWFCTLWKDGGPQTTDAKDFFETRKSSFRRMFFALYIVPVMIPELRLIANKSIPRYMIFEPFSAIRIVYPIKDPNTQKAFFKNIESIKTAAAAKGVHIALMQYPASRVYEPVIRAAGKQVKIPVVGDVRLFDELVRKEGFYSYFVDRAGDSGHLSPRGADMYGQVMARELLPFLKTAKVEHEK